jgi:hypothetical protein
MNDLVYPVNGGMEDWAYAGSWDPDLVIQCKPDTFNGYPTSQTRYDNSTLRVFNMLVETSNHKTPYQYELGTSLDIMTISETGNGHVARNIRLALLSVELVEPYVIIQTVNGMDLSDDIVPSVVRGGSTPCRTTKAVAVPHDSNTVTIQWIVGGALLVDKTTLFYTKWDKNIEAIIDCEEQPDLTKIQPLLTTATMTSSFTGSTQFSKTEATIFSATIDITNYMIDDQIMVIAMARVDQHWGRANDHVSDRDVDPMIGPQSHVVNARTNPNWYHTKPDGSKVIQGRLDWVSIPLTIVLKDYSKSNTIRVDVEELSLRYDESQIENNSDGTDSYNMPERDRPTGTDPSSSASAKGHWSVLPIMFVSMILVGGVIGYGSRTFLQHNIRQAHRERVREYIDDETAITPGLEQITSNTNSNGHIKPFSDTIDDTDRPDGVELGTYT